MPLTKTVTTIAVIMNCLLRVLHSHVCKETFRHAVEVDEKGGINATLMSVMHETRDMLGTLSCIPIEQASAYLKSTDITNLQWHCTRISLLYQAAGSKKEAMAGVSGGRPKINSKSILSIAGHLS
eukprot:scaffold135489_cov42-Prasinocladus_malaysianus.AAC.1